MAELVLTIPMSDTLKAPQRDRADRAVTLVRDFIGRHLKVKPATVKLGAGLNEALWAHGAKSVPKKVKVHAKKEEGLVWVELSDVPFVEPKGEPKGEAKAEAKGEPKAAEGGAQGRASAGPEGGAEEKKA